MALKRNMSRDEMIKFINDELVPQIELEIKNWIEPKKKQGGYFAVVRQIMCMIDFLGAVYSGYPLSERKNDPNGRYIATSKKAIKFIIMFFESKETYEKNVVENLHGMYRNGLIHLYQPKILKYGASRRLMWMFYKGKRHKEQIEADSDKGKIIFKDVHHLHIVKHPINKTKYYLAVSINCFYGDLKKAIQKYTLKLSQTKYLQRNWRTTVNAICKPRQLI